MTIKPKGRQIEGLIEQNGVYVVVNEDEEIVAFLFAGPWKNFEHLEMFNSLLNRLSELSFNSMEITTKNSFQYGPVCIDKEYRGKGLLNDIFEKMRVEFSVKYPISIACNKKSNIISEKAHVNKLGWKTIDEFEHKNNTYTTLAFDMKKSVLMR